jgi:hypothetical protein
MTNTWLDLPAAKKRLSQLEGEVQKLQAERALIESVLKGVGDKSVGDARPAPLSEAPKKRGRPRSQPGKGGRSKVSLVGLIVDALRFAPSSGLTVADIIAHIARRHPDRVSASNISALISSAVAQARKAKKPKIKVIKQGGPGVPSRYGAA